MLPTHSFLWKRTVCLRVMDNGVMITYLLPNCCKPTVFNNHKKIKTAEWLCVNVILFMLTLLPSRALFFPFSVVMLVCYEINHKEQMYLLSEMESPAPPLCSGILCPHEVQDAWHICDRWIARCPSWWPGFHVFRPRCHIQCFPVSTQTMKVSIWIWMNQIGKW